MKKIITCLLFILFTPWIYSATGDVSDLFSRDSLRIDKVVCPFKSTIEYKPGTIECGLLEVPENREKPDSRYIELHFVKLNSTWKDDESEGAGSQNGNVSSENKILSKLADGKRDDPVVYLTGGPGAQVVTYVKRFKDHGILKHRDLYILEQRGIGFSDDFCPFYNVRKPEKNNAKSFDDMLANNNQTARDCAVNALRAGVDLSGYNTIENARDVQALRMALGFKQWNVWGISYGSILGQAYIKQDPQGIRAIALDAIMPLFARDDALFWRVAKWYHRDLEKLQQACNGHASCGDDFPQLIEKLRSAAKQVAEQPIKVSVIDTEVYPQGEATTYHNIVAMLPFMFFYEQSNYAALPAIIDSWTRAVERKDEAIFQTISQMSNNFFSSSPGMRDAILCLDGGLDSQYASAVADMKEFPVLGNALGTEASYRAVKDRCREVGTAPRDGQAYQPVETDLPALIIEGDMDPITPPPLAKAIMPGFKNGTYVEFPYAGHGPSRSVKCAGDMLNLFFDKPTQKPDLSCVDEMKAPDFIAPLYNTSIVPQMAVLSMKDKKALAGPVIWFALPSVILVIGFLVMTIAPVFRWIDARQSSYTEGTRIYAWFTSLWGFLSLLIFALAIAKTVKQSEILMLFGLVSSAKWGALFGLLTGLFGLATLVQTFRAHKYTRLDSHTFIGFLLTGLSGVTLCLFYIVWDLSIF